MNYQDHLEILDTALGEYRDAEPLAGMEDRVLRRLRRSEKSNTSRTADTRITGQGFLLVRRKPISD